MSELSAHERIVLAIDTSSQYEAEGYMNIAERIGARCVKVSTALASATSWRYCADLADLHRRDWIADAKLHDAHGTVGDAVRAISDLDRQPYGITVHAAAGEKALLAALANSEGVNIFGVAGIPSLPPVETEEIYGAPPERNGGSLARRAARAGISGLLISPRELAVVKWTH
jgi:orotidine-5'-phosphate decarboxylase